MKKPYQKPLLIQENFLLSENIAACDTNATNNLNITVEVLQFAGYFAAGTCGKALDESYEFEYNGNRLCYHTSNGVNVFSS